MYPETCHCRKNTNSNVLFSIFQQILWEEMQAGIVWRPSNERLEIRHTQTRDEGSTIPSLQLGGSCLLSQDVLNMCCVCVCMCQSFSVIFLERNQLEKWCRAALLPWVCEETDRPLMWWSLDGDWTLPHHQQKCWNSSIHCTPVPPSDQTTAATALNPEPSTAREREPAHSLHDWVIISLWG